MLFEFNARSGLLLPFVLAGGLATGGLLVRAFVRRTAPDALLALLLLLPTLSVAERMLYYAGWNTHPGYVWWLQYGPWHLGLAVGPSYYLYFRSLTNQTFRWRSYRWHLLPGLLQLVTYGAAALADWLLDYPAHQPATMGATSVPGPGATLLESLGRPLSMLGYGLLLGYSLRMLVDYQPYRRYLNDNFSNPERLRFSGLQQLLGLQLLGLTLSVVFTGLDAAFDFSTDVGWVAFALRGGLIYGLLVVGIESNYAAATTPLRFEADVDETSPAPTNLPWPEQADLPASTNAPVAANVPVSHSETGPGQADQLATGSAIDKLTLPPELEPWRTRLLHLMDTQQLWLEPDLTLTELARQVGIHPVLLSKVINMGLGQNFNDFVNAYRVADAQRKLRDPRYAHYSLLGIALECGFSSKSTFTRAFKKLTGALPSEAMRVKL